MKLETSTSNILVEKFTLSEFMTASEQINFECSDWQDNESSDTVRSLAHSGRESLVQDAQVFLDKLALSLPETRGFKWVPSPCGAYPVIPDYLSSSPTSMRQRRRQIRSNAPLKFFVSTTSSGGIDNDVLRKRGLAILALLLETQKVRPVELNLLIELGGGHNMTSRSYIGIITLDSSPLSLSQAGYLLTSQGFARGLTYEYAETTKYSRGSWPGPYYHLGGMDFEARYEKWLRELIQASDDDVIVPSAFINTIGTNPVKWLQDNLARLTSN